MSMVPSEKVLRVLNIEDSIRDSELIQETLKKLGSGFFFHRVTNRGELEEALQEESWELIISAMSVNSIRAEETLSMVHERFPHLPFILVSDGVCEEKVVDMMKAGMEDFVSKSRLERLIPVVKRLWREVEVRDKAEGVRKLIQEANAAREQMLAVVSHDIKNPLSVIQLEAQMLLRSLEKKDPQFPPDSVKVHAGRILKTAEELKRLVSELLNKNKRNDGLSALSKEMVELGELFKEALDSQKHLMRKKGISIWPSFPGTAMYARLDRAKMLQVLSHLLENAIGHTPQGGSISLVVEENSDEFTISVSDTGPGLGPQDLNLFICKTIIEAHSGCLMVDDLLRGGALFTFTLPKSTIQYVNRRDLRRKIMIVDDDEDLRDVMSWALSKEGYAIQSFRDPLEAVESLRSGENTPHLILADYHMHGMRGEDFLSMKGALPAGSGGACPVVMISASPRDVIETVPPGLYQEVITKPFDLEGLVDSMRKYVH